MKTNYVIGYIGSDSLISAISATGQPVYTPDIKDALHFDSEVEAILEMFCILDHEKHHVIAV